MPNALPYYLLFLISLFVLGKTADALEEKFIHVAKALKISEFFVGFLILGFATSLPEFSVLLNALFLKTPELSLGNLSGGIFIIFGLLLPLRAVIGHGLPFKGRFGVRELFFTILYIALPFGLIAVFGPTKATGFVLMAAYPLLVYLASHRHRHSPKFSEEPLGQEIHRVHWLRILSTISLLLLLLFVTADVTVRAAHQITLQLSVPAFIFGLTFLALGTNLPELSIMLASLRSPAKSKVAVGDLLGSAAVNTLLLGLLLIIAPPASFSVTSFYLTALAAIFLLSLFFFFSWRHQEITLPEGVALILVYLVFAMSELVL